MKNVNIIILFFCLFAVSCDQADPTGNELPEINATEDFITYLEGEMEAQNIPALSVLIFKEDQILFENYGGKSQIQENRALSGNQPFLLASVSKMVTATALLQLHDQGLFELDEPINNYLPFTVNIPNQSTAITFEMLLTHTSGIADGPAMDEEYYYGEDSPIALDTFLENYLVPGGTYYDASQNFYDFEPGSVHKYSNSGCALIGVLVEQIADQDFDAYCKEHIFQPLGLNQTFWSLEEALQSGLNLVQPYNVSGDNVTAVEHYTFTDYPNGALRSTAKDLSVFLSAFVLNGRANNYQLLNAETIAAMIQSQIPNIEEGIGWHTFEMDATNELWGHSGGEEGVSTIVAFNADTKIGIIVLSNQGDAELEEIVVEGYELGKNL